MSKSRWHTGFVLQPAFTLAAVLALAGCYGDRDLPSTVPAGRGLVTTINLVPAANISVGAAFPVEVEALIVVDGGAPDGGLPSGVCIALTASPGRLVFPFDVACPSDTGIPAHDVGASVDGGDGGAQVGDAGTGKAAGDFVLSTGCAAVRQTPAGPRVEALAAYVPAASEASASLFASLYFGDRCSGPPQADVGVTVSIPGGTTAGSADGGPSDGSSSDQGMSDGQGDGSSMPPMGDGPDQASSDGGVDGPVDAATEGK